MKIHSRHTNSQRKHNKISIAFFSLVFALLVSALTLSNPDNVKADASGIWTADSGSQPYVYIPGSLYWAGSEQKTGLLIYCVNTRTGVNPHPWVPQNKRNRHFQAIPIDLNLDI